MNLCFIFFLRYIYLYGILYVSPGLYISVIVDSFGGDKIMVTHTKSVHLYGRPNLNKHQQLQKIEKSYQKQVNFFIIKLYDNEKYWLDVFNNSS